MHCIVNETHKVVRHITKRLSILGTSETKMQMRNKTSMDTRTHSLSLLAHKAALKKKKNMEDSTPSIIKLGLLTESLLKMLKIKCRFTGAPPCSVSTCWPEHPLALPAHCRHLQHCQGAPALRHPRCPARAARCCCCQAVQMLLLLFDDPTPARFVRCVRCGRHCCDGHRCHCDSQRGCCLGRHREL